MKIRRPKNKSLVAVASSLLLLLLVGSAGAFRGSSGYRRLPHQQVATRPTTVSSFFLSPVTAGVPYPIVFAGAVQHHPLSSSANADDDAGIEQSSMSKPPFAPLLGMFGAVTHLVVRFGYLQKFAFLKTASKLLLAAFMLAGAAMRLDRDTVNDVLIPMVPPPLPARLCVYASGAVEVVCGLFLLTPTPRWSVVGAKLTIALLLGVFPANIYHAASKKAQEGVIVKAPQAALNARVAFQLLFIYWATWFIVP